MTNLITASQYWNGRQTIGSGEDTCILGKMGRAGQDRAAAGITKKPLAILQRDITQMLMKPITYQPLLLEQPSGTTATCAAINADGWISASLIGDSSAFAVNVTSNGILVKLLHWPQNPSHPQHTADARILNNEARFGSDATRCVGYKDVVPDNNLIVSPQDAVVVVSDGIVDRLLAKITQQYSQKEEIIQHATDSTQQLTIKLYDEQSITKFEEVLSEYLTQQHFQNRLSDFKKQYGPELYNLWEQITLPAEQQSTILQTCARQPPTKDEIAEAFFSLQNIEGCASRDDLVVAVAMKPSSSAETAVVMVCDGNGGERNKAPVAEEVLQRIFDITALNKQESASKYCAPITFNVIPASTSLYAPPSEQALSPFNAHPWPSQKTPTSASSLLAPQPSIIPHPNNP